MKHPRIYLAGLYHETNTFVEKSTPASAFEITRGDALFQNLGNASPMDGFLTTAKEYGWEVVPGVDYRAIPSGPVEDTVFEDFWNEVHETLTAALSRKLDAIFLILHGAMAAETIRDVEGELLERIRNLSGAESLPVFGVLDLHANVSERMAQHASALIPYRENPHIDARETAVRAARLLHRTLTTNSIPQNHYIQPGILLAPPSTGTADTPMKQLAAQARALEAEYDSVWEAAIAPGFAHADTPDTGMSIWIVTNQPSEITQKALDTLASQAKTLTQNLETGEWDLQRALDVIEAEKNFPALLVEPADNIGGGAPGDATFILRALLERPIGKSGVAISDPETVKLLQQHQIGETIQVSIGGKGSSLDPGPVELEVTLERLSDGKFELEDKQSHLASMLGIHIEMGDCAVVRHKHLTILLTGTPVAPFDLGQWRSQGINPEELDIIGVKAAVAHRRAYDKIAKSSFTVQTPGPNTSDLHSLPYHYLHRPIFPLG